MTKEDKFTIFILLTCAVILIVGMFYGVNFLIKLFSPSFQNFNLSFSLPQISLFPKEYDYNFNIPSTNVDAFNKDYSQSVGRDLNDGEVLDFTFLAPSRKNFVLNVQTDESEGIAEDASSRINTLDPNYNFNSVLNLTDYEINNSPTTLISDTAQSSIEIQIPKAGIDASVWEGRNGTELLKKGFWVYPDSGKLGLGEVVILCHRRYFGPDDPRSCWFLDSLAKDDLIYVYEGNKEVQHKFKVVGVSVFDANSPEIYNIDKNSAYIRIVTCHPLYSNAQRLVVLAKRI